jgi:hypothetical protein
MLNRSLTSKRPVTNAGHLENDVPGQKIGDPLVRVMGDAVDDGAEMGFTIEAVHLGGP